MTRLAGHRQARASAGEWTLVQRTEALGLCDRLIGPAPRAGAVGVFEAPAGGGKSAVLRAACSLAESRGFRVLRAAGSEIERDFPYGVVRQLFEPVLESDRAAAVPAWGAAPVGSPYEVHHAMVSLLAELSATRPVLLAVDDLGLADAPSLDFLGYLTQRQAQYRVVTVVALNPGNGGVEVGSPLSLLRIQQAGTVVRLEPIGARGVAELLAQAGKPSAPDVCEELVRITGGNPFLLSSLIGSAHMDRALLERLGRIDGESAVPPQVTRDLALRLARLSPAAGQLARTAAVLGDGTSVTVAARTMDARPAVALDALDTLAEADVLRRSGMIAFSAPLLRVALYGMLGPGERSRLHRRAARALCHARASPAEAASHLMRADGAGEAWARDVLRAAARQLVEPQQAVAYLRRALSEEAPGTVRGDLLAELAAAELSGDGSDAARHLTEAIELLPPGLDRAEACEQLGRVLWGLGRYAEASRAFTEGLNGPGGSAGEVGSRLSAACLAAGRVQPGAGALGSTRGALTPNLDEPAMTAQLALELLLAGGERDQVVELAQRALAGGRLLRQQTGGGPGYQAAVCVLIWADELDAAARAATLGIADAERRDLQPARAVLLLLRASALFRRGRLWEAQRDAGVAAGGAPAPLPVPVPPPESLLAEIGLEQGHAKSAREAATRSVEAAAAGADATAAGKVQYALALGSRGRIRLAGGDSGAALSDLLECGRQLREAEVRNPAVAPWRTHAAIAALRLGDREQAATLAAEERELADAFGAPRSRGLALIAAAGAGSREERARGLREAAAALEQSPAMLDRAHALADLGAELRRSGHRRDSRDALRHALDLAVRCGADVLARRARQDLVATGARPRRSRISGVGSLTPRERQIAELAAQGQSNRAIADQLIVSEKTIEWHLANAYRKLEIRGRGALAASLTQV